IDHPFLDDSYLFEEGISTAIWIKNNLTVKSSTIDEAVREGITLRLLKGEFEKAKIIIEEFKPNSNILRFPEIQNLAFHELTKVLSQGDLNAAIEIKNLYQFEEELLL